MLSAELSSTEQCIAEGYTFQLPPFAGRQESLSGQIERPKSLVPHRINVRSWLFVNLLDDLIPKFKHQLQQFVALGVPCFRQGKRLNAVLNN